MGTFTKIWSKHQIRTEALCLKLKNDAAPALLDGAMLPLSKKNWELTCGKGYKGQRRRGHHLSYFRGHTQKVVTLCSPPMRTFVKVFVGSDGSKARAGGEALEEDANAHLSLELRRRSWCWRQRKILVVTLVFGKQISF